MLMSKIWNLDIFILIIIQGYSEFDINLMKECDYISVVRVILRSVKQKFMNLDSNLKSKYFHFHWKKCRQNITVVGVTKSLQVLIVLSKEHFKVSVSEIRLYVFWVFFRFLNVYSLKIFNFSIFVLNPSEKMAQLYKSAISTKLNHFLKVVLENWWIKHCQWLYIEKTDKTLATNTYNLTLLTETLEFFFENHEVCILFFTFS